MKGSSESYPRLPSASDGRGAARIVRPDCVVVVARCVIKEVEAERAVAMLEQAAVEFEAELGRLAPGASLRLGALTFEEGVGKKRTDAREVTTALEAEAMVPLGEGQGYWERARLVARLVAWTRRIEASLRERKASVRVRFGAPSPRVQEPEAHRDALIEQWVARARAVARVGSEGQAALHLLGLTPPPVVTQRALSVEAVALELALRGRIDALAPGDGGSKAG